MVDVIDNRYLSILRTHISDERLAHSLRVAHTASEMAVHFKIDPEHAILAGLLHDIAKQETPVTMTERGIIGSIETRKTYDDFKSIWHQYAGADYVAHYFPDIPQSVLSAIQSHTTGSPNMNLMDQIIYLADAVEPGRTYRSREDLYRLSFENIDLACFGALALSMSTLITSQRTIHPQSVEAYNFYLRKVGAGNAKVVARILHL
ncbi:HD domain-containing protein [bacterium]|nr:HD domain-containing protein [bacterium]